jgi:hypothetical protein
MSKTQNSNSRKVRAFLTFAVLALMAGVGIFTTSAAFTATTSNPGNLIEAGTVAVGDSDAGTGKLYNALAQGPGAGPAAACIRVTYSGSLGSSIKLYRGAVTNGDKFNLTVERGGTTLTAPAADMNCTGFVAASTAFNNTLNLFPTTYGAGVDGKAGGAAWSSGQSVDYRFTVTVVDDSTPNAHTSAVDTGAHSFTWEAQNN